MKKLIAAGKLKNLNDLVIGSSVLCSDGSVGYVRSISNIVSINFDHEKMIGDVGECKATITYPQSGESYHTYRRDGRSHCDAESDIVMICPPDKTKVKQIKVSSKTTMTINKMKIGNDAAIIYKLAYDTGKIKGRGVKEYGAYKITRNLTEKGLLTIAIEDL